MLFLVLKLDSYIRIIVWVVVTVVNIFPMKMEEGLMP